MNHAIKIFVKYNKWVYITYSFVMSFLVNFLKNFIKADDKLILFVSFGGKHYSDSPKCVYEEIQSDKRFEGYRFVWAFENPSKFDVNGATKIKIDTLNYFITAIKARVWITNVGVERALNFVGKNTYYLCTSHGVSIKGLNEEGNAFTTRYQCHYDCILAQSKIDQEIEMKHFGLAKDQVKILGLPRNDKFVNDNSLIKEKVRSYYDVPYNKKVLLYAPTFRDWKNGKEDLSIDLEKWRKTISDRYVLLFRAHPAVKAELPNDDEFFKNASRYEDMDELLITADVLISDYSSLFFDYSIMHKPMICWAYDYATFSKYRKLRINMVEEIYGGQISEERLLSIINEEDYGEAIKMATDFQEKYVTVYGNAAKATVDLIYSQIKTSQTS